MATEWTLHRKRANLPFKGTLVHKPMGINCQRFNSLLTCTGAVAISVAMFGQGAGPIVMDNVQCTGNENSLMNCTFLTSHNCRHSEDAGVRCRTIINASKCQWDYKIMLLAIARVILWVSYRIASSKYLRSIKFMFQPSQLLPDNNFRDDLVGTPIGLEISVDKIFVIHLNFT